MSNATAEAVVLRSPGECIATIPSLMGFTPEDSLIAVWLKDGSLLVTQRADMEAVLASDPSVFFQQMQTNGTNPDEVILIAWSDTFTIAGNEKLADVVAYAEQRWGVRDFLWVSEGMWGSVLCEDPLCCPPEGKPIDPSLKGQSLPTPVASREDLTMECKPVGTTLMKPLDPHGIEGWRDKQIDRFLTVWSEGGFESPKHIARAGRALHDIRVRDTLLWYAATSLTPNELTEAYDFAACVARAMHPDNAAPACTVAAIFAWTMGDGARANIALGHALNSDPGYSLARLVQQSLSAGLPPAVWQDSMQSLTLDVVRHGDK